MKKLILLTTLFSLGVLVWILPAKPQDDYSRIYALPTLGEKRRAMVALPYEQQAEVWRRHFNSENDKYFLTPEQVNFQSYVLTVVADPERRGKETLEAEALELFPDETMRNELFGTIGPSNCKPTVYQRMVTVIFAPFITAAWSGECNCSYGSICNKSCGNTCGDTQGPCVETLSSCGCAMLYPCNALCNTNEGN